MLTPRQIELDGDEGASEIYSFTDRVAAHVTSDIARAIVDLNRSESDRSPDGVVKETTIWGEPVYSQPLSEATIEQLIAKYHRPYHDQIRKSVAGSFLFSVDCHTMADCGPPVGPDPGVKRPMICLGDCRGQTFPSDWLNELYDCFDEQFPDSVKINQPFSGGYITRTHGAHSPWIQLEVSRSNQISHEQKKQGIFQALEEFCQRKS